MAGGTNIPDTTPLANEMRQILLARQMLRTLDAQVVRTEARLQKLPALAARAQAASGGGSTTPGMNSAQRLAARSMPRKMAGNKLGFGPLQIGRQGVGLDVGYMKGVGGRALTGAIGFHVVAGVINQGANLVDRQNELQREGFNATQRTVQGALDIARAPAETLATLSGATGLASSLLRASGFTKEDADRRVAAVFEKLFDPAAGVLRQRRLRAGLDKVVAEVSQKYRDANEFLDSWTPDDFDVGNDAGRAALRDEVIRKNRKYVNAFYDAQLDSGSRRAIQDSRGD